MHFFQHRRWMNLLNTFSSWTTPVSPQLTFTVAIQDTGMSFVFVIYCAFPGVPCLRPPSARPQRDQWSKVAVMMINLAHRHTHTHAQHYHEEHCASSPSPPGPDSPSPPLASFISYDVEGARFFQTRDKLQHCIDFAKTERWVNFQVLPNVICSMRVTGIRLWFFPTRDSSELAMTFSTV